MSKKLSTSKKNRNIKPKKVLEYSYEDMETSISDGKEIGEEYENIILATIGWLDLKKEGIDPEDFEKVAEYAIKKATKWGITEELIANYYEADWYWNGTEAKHEWDNAWQLTLHKLDTRPYNKPIKIKIPIKETVFQDYDTLDKAMINAGYQTPEMASNRLKNPQLKDELSGWIATMGDQYTSPEKQIQDLNKKLEKVTQKGLLYNVKFNQTGNFSVGYTIYTMAVA